MHSKELCVTLVIYHETSMLLRCLARIIKMRGHCSPPYNKNFGRILEPFRIKVCNFKTRKAAEAERIVVSVADSRTRVIQAYWAVHFDSFSTSFVGYNQRDSIFSLNTIVYLLYKNSYMFRLLEYSHHQAAYKKKWTYS